MSPSLPSSSALNQFMSSSMFSTWGKKNTISFLFNLRVFVKSSDALFSPGPPLEKVPWRSLSSYPYSYTPILQPSLCIVQSYQPKALIHILKSNMSNRKHYSLDTANSLNDTRLDISSTDRLLWHKIFDHMVCSHRGLPLNTAHRSEQEKSMEDKERLQSDDQDFFTSLVFISLRGMA